MKKIQLDASLETFVKRYPKTKHGFACACFEKLGFVITRALQTNEQFETVIQSFLDAGFDTVDFSVSVKLDGETLVLNQTLLKGEANDKALSFEI